MLLNCIKQKAIFLMWLNCIEQQCVTVPKMLNDTYTDTFFGTGSETFFRYQILPIQVPRLFRYQFLFDTGSDTTRKITNFRYWYLWYKFSDAGSETFSGTKFFRYRFRDFFPVPNLSDTGSETFFRYQFFPIPPKNTGTSHSVEYEQQVIFGTPGYRASQGWGDTS